MSAAALVIGFTGVAAWGQGGLPFTIEPAADSIGFGQSVAAGGDVDGDGLPDIFVADPEFPGGVRWSVHSGVDGRMLWEKAQAFEYFLSVKATFVGDVNDDDRDDLLVANDVGYDGQRTIGMYSGADGELLYEIDATKVWDLCATGDVDGDLISDFAYCAMVPQELRYEVVVCSGANGEVLRRRPTGRDAAHAIRNLGDVNGALVPDLVCLIGSSGGYMSQPMLVAISGATGEIIWQQQSPELSGPPVGSLAAGSDLTGDQIGDLVSRSGSLVQVFNGANGQLLRTFAVPETGENWGHHLAFADINADGRVELVGQRWNETRFGVDVIDKSAQVILWAEGITGIGEQVSGGYQFAVADLNGDGADDFVIGSAHDGVRVLGGGRLLLNFAQRQTDYVVERGQMTEFSIAGGLPGRSMRLLGSLQGSGCTFVPPLGICIDLDQRIYQLGSAASNGQRVARIQLTVPSDMPLGPLWLQAIDPADPNRGAITSNVVQLEVTP